MSLSVSDSTMFQSELFILSLIVYQHCDGISAIINKVQCDGTLSKHHLVIIIYQHSQRVSEYTLCLLQSLKTTKFKPSRGICVRPCVGLKNQLLKKKRLKN